MGYYIEVNLNQNYKDDYQKGTIIKTIQKDINNLFDKW